MSDDRWEAAAQFWRRYAAELLEENGELRRELVDATFKREWREELQAVRDAREQAR